MKKIIFSSFFVLVGALSLAFFGGTAHADWTTLQSSTTKEFTGISCPDARTCFLVSGMYLSGGSGSIVKTTDGGETFTVLNSPTLNPLHAVSCSSIATCYATGDFGTLLKTINGGETWIEIDIGSKTNTPRFTNVLALDDSMVIVIGRDGTLFRSEDGGGTWGRPTVKSVSDFYAIYFSDKKNGFIGGDDGALFFTEDGGATWTYQNALHLAGQILGLSGDGKQTVFAVGDTVNKSLDGGKTWTAQSLLSKSNSAVTVVDAKTAYVLADLNSILSTADGGTTWKTDVTAVNAFFKDITCPEVGYCLAVGSSGRVLRLGTPPAPVAPVVPITVPVAPSTPVVATPVAPTPEPVVAPTVMPVATNVFTRTLKKGASGNDVKKLQELLAGVGGVYDGGETTGYFGPSTSRALGKFQEKYSLAKPGQAGYGEAGPKTRAKLIETAEKETSGTATETAVVKTPAKTVVSFMRKLKKGSSGNDVKKLQEILSADKEVYPEGDISGYFGPATKKAVGKFQEKYGLAGPKDAGYGELGPKTRAKLSEVAE